MQLYHFVVFYFSGGSFLKAHRYLEVKLFGAENIFLTLSRFWGVWKSIDVEISFELALKVEDFSKIDSLVRLSNVKDSRVKTELFLILFGSSDVVLRAQNWHFGLRWLLCLARNLGLVQLRCIFIVQVLRLLAEKALLGCVCWSIAHFLFQFHWSTSMHRLVYLRRILVVMTQIVLEYAVGWVSRLCEVACTITRVVLSHLRRTVHSL